MADDIIEHLPTVDVLEDHVVVMLVNDHFAHSTDIRVMEEHGKCGLSKSTNFPRGIFGGLPARRVVWVWM